MNLQKKLDMTEQYINIINLFKHPSTGIEYTVIPGSKFKSGPINIEVSYGREERTQR